MTARYKSGPPGVWDNEAQRAVYMGTADWGVFVRWLDAGNVPDEWSAPPHVPTADEIAAAAENAARDNIEATLRADAYVQALRTRTPAQVDAWIDSTVTDLASARAVLKIVARILALIARERIKGA